MSHSLLERPAAESDEAILQRARKNKRRSQIRVWGLRALLVVVWLASWELAATTLLPLQMGVDTQATGIQLGGVPV